MGVHWRSAFIFLVTVTSDLVAAQATTGAVDRQTAQAPPTVVAAAPPARAVERVDTGALLKTEFEPPVEKKNTDGSSQLGPDGKRQFELRVHNRTTGIDTMLPITPTSGQESMENPSIFYRDVKNGQGEVRRHEVYTILPPEQGGIITVVSTNFKETTPATVAPPTSQVPEGVYRSDTYPAHADKDSYNRFFYHMTVFAGKPPLTVVPRVSTALFTSDSKLSYPGRAVAGVMGIPNYAANIMSNIDYSQISKNGDRWRDWMAIDAANNITYFQLTPAHELKKGKDGPWDIHVSKNPPELYDPKKMGK